MMAKPMTMKWPGGKGERDIQVLVGRHHLKNRATDETLQWLFKKEDGGAGGGGTLDESGSGQGLVARFVNTVLGLRDA